MDEADDIRVRIELEIEKIHSDRKHTQFPFISPPDVSTTRITVCVACDAKFCVSKIVV